MKILLWSLLLVPLYAQAECRDYDAVLAGEAKALSYFGKQGKVFYPGKVMSVHLPGRRKEVAAYVQYGQKKYSIFSLVDENCKARFIKRTRQND